MAAILIYALLFVCFAVAVRGSIKSLRGLPPYVGPLGRSWHIGFRVICGAILLFLIMPILVIIPLSFNSEPYFTYPMPGFSLRWYEDFFVGEQSAGSRATESSVSCSRPSGRSSSRTTRTSAPARPYTPINHSP